MLEFIEISILVSVFVHKSLEEKDSEMSILNVLLAGVVGSAFGLVPETPCEPKATEIYGTLDIRK